MTYDRLSKTLKTTKLTLQNHKSYNEAGIIALLAKYCSYKASNILIFVNILIFIKDRKNVAQ